MNTTNILERNLSLVFNERDQQKRLAAISELYSIDAVMYEPEKVVSGQEAISEAVDRLQAIMPPNFNFQSTGATVGHHGLLCMRWKGSTSDESVVITGIDVAHLEDERISSLYVLIDPPLQ